MKNIFSFKTLPYGFRSSTTLQCRSTRIGPYRSETETIYFLGPKICAVLPPEMRNTESSDSLQEVPVAVHTSGFLLLSQLGASCSTQLMLDFVAAWAFFVLTSFLTSLRGYMLQAMQGVLVEILSTCTHDR